jgi:hypothetical protein
MKRKLILKKVRILFSLFLLFGVFVATAQSQKTITGTVFSSEDNTPLPGASVVERGTNNGTSTDFDGNFSLTVKEDATTLVISYVGYNTQEVAITNDPITVILQLGSNSLDELVVVGYGTIKKSDIIS